MRMKAVDTFHTSQTRTVQGGQEFEVHDQLGKELQAAGFAQPVGDAASEGAKAEPAPENKAEEPVSNKAVPAKKRSSKAEEE